MTPERAIPGSRSSRWPACAVAALILMVLAAIGAGLAYQRLHPRPASTDPVFPATQGRLEISVSEAGTIAPKEQIILKSELEGRSTILYLIPEGTSVKAGDLLVELDVSSLEDRRVEQAIRSENAEAAFIRSRENLEVVRNQAQSDVEKAELNLRFAREDLEQYQAGEFPNLLKEREARITLAREEWQRAQEKLKWSQVLFAEKYLSESEIQADALAVRKATLDVELAENNLELLRAFESKRQIAKLESDLRQAEMALERAVRKARADVIQAEADLRARESEFSSNQSHLQKLVEQIAKARIRAPRAGLVVYATSTQVQWRGNVEPLAEGQEVRERQELIYLPTDSGFIARIKIHESSLKRIARQMPVTLTVDALPGSVFTGSVATIAPLPDAMSAFMNPDLKLYDTEIRIDGGADVLRTGMSCQATIRIAEHEDTLYVPLQCVVRSGGSAFVYVDTGSGPAPRAVKVGEHNDRMIQILEGLAPGEPVLLAPPLGAVAGIPDKSVTPPGAAIPGETPSGVRRIRNGDDDAPSAPRPHRTRTKGEGAS